MTSKQIRIIRKRLDLTQEKMSAFLGMSWQGYYRWESGGADKSVVAANLIIQELLVIIQKLLENTPLDPIEKAFLVKPERKEVRTDA